MSDFERVCPKCGTANASRRTRCTKCGTYFTEPPAYTPAPASPFTRKGAALFALSATAFMARLGFKMVRRSVAAGWTRATQKPETPAAKDETIDAAYSLNGWGADTQKTVTTPKPDPLAGWTPKK